ncbi:hypothetical protein ACSSS7_004137 [Eimeria intestinalis]
MVGRAFQAETAAVADPSSAAAKANPDLCLRKEHYFAGSFKLLLQNLLGGAPTFGAQDGAVFRDAACCAGPPGGLAVAEKVLLLLPVCARCSALSACERDDLRCSKTSNSSNSSSNISSISSSNNSSKASRNGSGKVTERIHGTDDVSCVCSKCASSLLLQLLLLLGLHKLRTCDSPGVLFCGSDDVPETQEHFFAQLLGTHEEPAWWVRGSSTHAESSSSSKGVNPAFHREDYVVLSRIGYKLLPGPKTHHPPPHQTGTVHAPPACEPPLLLRYLAELPQALQERPPGLLLLLQPSRWLTPAGRLHCGETATLQHLTNKRSYGLFLALLVRAAGGGPPCCPFPSSTSSGVEGQLRAGEKGVIQAPKACVAAVAERFLACSKCCWRCSGGVPVSRRGSVPLCCLEQSEWLCMLRSRFTRILLVVCASVDAFNSKQKTTHKASAHPREAQRDSLLVADVTGVALPGTSTD